MSSTMDAWPADLRDKLYRRALAKWGEGVQMLMVVEEMSELTKAILKTARNGNPLQLIVDLMEEAADVEIMLEQMRVIFGDMAENLSKRDERLRGLGVDHFKARKLDRLAERLGVCPACRGQGGWGGPHAPVVVDCQQCDGTGQVRTAP